MSEWFPYYLKAEEGKEAVFDETAIFHMQIPAL